MSKDLIHRLSAFIACVLVLAQPALAAGMKYPDVIRLLLGLGLRWQTTRD